MGAAEQRNKSAKMAADLVKKGIYHGKRTTTPHHNNIPVNEPGSAAYRRLQRSKKGRAQLMPQRPAVAPVQRNIKGKKR